MIVAYKPCERIEGVKIVIKACDPFASFEILAVGVGSATPMALADLEINVGLAIERLKSELSQARKFLKQAQEILA